MTVRIIALCFLVFLSLATFADTLTGKVVKITDGDTPYVLDADGDGGVFLYFQILGCARGGVRTVAKP